MYAQNEQKLMATVTGDIGGQPVSLDNMATENTLREILAAINRQTAILGRRQQGGAGGAGSQGGGANAQQTQQNTLAQNQNTQAQNRNTQSTNQNSAAATASSKALDGLAKTAGVLGGIVGDLAASAFKTAGNLTDFAGSLMDGQGSLAGFYTALKDLPLGMGLVAGLFAKIAKMQEDELNTYRTLTTAGVNFGGSLGEIRQNALDLGLTMDQYASVVTKNGEVMAMLGGAANKGAEYFTKLNKELRSSPAGAELRALGFTAEQTANGMAMYLKMTGGRTSEELKNTKAISQAAAGYMKELDALAAFTGKSREEQEQAAAAAAQDAAYQQLMQGKSEEEKLKGQKALMEIEAKYGKAGGEAYKARMLGLPPISEGAQILEATMKGFGGAMDRVVGDVKDTSKSARDMDKSLTGLSQVVAKGSKDLGPQMTFVLARGGDALGEVVTMAAKHQNDLYAKGAETQEKEEKLREKIIKEQEERQKSSAAAAAESEKALKDLGAQIYGALRPVIEALIPIINSLAQEMIGFAVENMPAIKAALTQVAEFIKEFAKNLMSEEGRNKIINDISYYFQLMLIEIKKAILPKFMYNEKDAEADKAKLGIEKEAYDKKAQEAQLSKDLASKQAQLEKEKDVEKSEQLRQEIEAIKKQKESAKEIGDKAAARSKEIKEGDESLSGVGGAAAGAATLGAAGALIGSFVPILGTAIGGAIGAAIGGVAGGLGMIDYGVKGSKPTDEEIEKYNKKDVKPPEKSKAAKGGIFEGPESGYGPIFLHGKEMVLPMDMLSDITKKQLPDLQTSVMPAVSPMANEPIDISALKDLFTNPFSDLKTSFTQDISNQTESAEQQSSTLQSYFNDLSTKLKEQNTTIAQTLNNKPEEKKSDKKTSESYTINGKPVSKEDFDKFMKNNPELAQLMKSAQDGLSKTTTPVNATAQPEQQKQSMLDSFVSSAKNIFPDFTSKLPSIGDIGSRLKESFKDVSGVTDINKQIQELKQGMLQPNIEDTATKNAQLQVTNENFIKELQTLNKQTSEMVKYLRMTVDESRQTNSGIKNLSGNLYS